MTHIFSDRRCLYLPDVPECLWLSEDDEYISEWADNKLDTWENAKLMTETMSSKLLEYVSIPSTIVCFLTKSVPNRTLLGHGLHISNHSDIDQLSRFLKSSTSQETCQTPLRTRNVVYGPIPAEVLQKLTIVSDVSVESASAVHDMELVMDTLGRGIYDFELSYPWYEALFNGKGSAWSQMDKGDAIQLTITTSHEKLGLSWPTRFNKCSARVSNLSIASGLEKSTIYQWEVFSALTHLSLAVPDVSDATHIAINANRLKALVPGFQTLQLTTSALTTATELRGELSLLQDSGIEVRITT